MNQSLLNAPNVDTSSPKIELFLCKHKLVEFACLHWHYSKCVPKGKLFKIGIKENDKFIGVILFGNGANNNIGKPYNLHHTEVCELTRIALTNHQCFVTQLISESIKLLKKHNPKLRLIVSYADTQQGHLGTIYQASNWIYTGQTKTNLIYFYKGEWYHGRALRSTLGYTPKNIPSKYDKPKHKYLMPLDKKMRKLILPLSKPYPKN